YTEQLLRTVALKLRGIPSTEAGTQVLEDFLGENNIPSDGVHLYDGCGLSRHDAISAKAMSRLLSFNSKQKYFPSFLRSLWIAGDTTSIENHRTFGLNTPVARKAFIKDGYISGVRSHSGYVRTKSGRLVSFSFIANNYNGGTGAIEKIHLALMIKLAELP
ncbi:MAG: D-alanyl-D-alanine carboxypeptidase, partial [Methanococcaceae archaeon]